MAEVKLPKAVNVIAVSAVHHTLVTTDDALRDDFPAFEVYSSVQFWHLDTGQPKETPDWDAQKISCVRVDSDGRILAVEVPAGPIHNHRSGDKENNAVVWDVLARKKLCSIPDAGSAILSLDRTLLATSTTETKIKLWDPSKESKIKLWDPSNGKQLGVISKEGEYLSPDMINPGNTRLLQRNRSGRETNSIWDISRQPARELPTFEVDRCVFSPDGKWLMSRIRRDGSVPDWVIWDLQMRRTFAMPDSVEYPPQFSPGSRNIACIVLHVRPANYLDRFLGKDGSRSRYLEKDAVVSTSVQIWDLESGTVIACIDDPCHFAWFPDGKSLATCKYDETIEIWDVPPRRPLWVDYGLPAGCVALVLTAGCYWRWRRSQLALHRSIPA